MVLVVVSVGCKGGDGDDGGGDGGGGGGLWTGARGKDSRCNRKANGGDKTNGLKKENK